MPRTARAARGGVCYHVLNRGNERQVVFHNEIEYASFLQLLQRARKHQPMRIIGLCLMPNHFHLCLWPRHDGDLGRYMQWLMTAHISQFRKAHPGTGHVWQGRFKAFPVQPDGHLLTVLRYIERNPVRAGLVTRAEDWSASSAAIRMLPVASTRNTVALDDGPVPRPPDWLEATRLPEQESALDAMRACINLGSPFGERSWAGEFGDSSNASH